MLLIHSTTRCRFHKCKKNETTGNLGVKKKVLQGRLGGRCLVWLVLVGNHE